MAKLLAFVVLVLLAGCETRTDYGACIGAFDKQNPKLNYKLSVRNTLVGVVFVEMIVPPIVVIADETLCPEGPTP